MQSVYDLQTFCSLLRFGHDYVTTKFHIASQSGTLFTDPPGKCWQTVQSVMQRCNLSFSEIGNIFRNITITITEMTTTTVDRNEHNAHGSTSRTEPATILVLDDDTDEEPSTSTAIDQREHVIVSVPESDEHIALPDDEREALEIELRMQRLRRRRELFEREIMSIDQELDDINVPYRSVVNSEQFQQYQQSIKNGTIDEYLISMIGMRRRRTIPRTFADVNHHTRQL